MANVGAPAGIKQRGNGGAIISQLIIFIIKKGALSFAYFCIRAMRFLEKEVFMGRVYTDRVIGANI